MCIRDRIVETNDEWIRSRTGIGARRIATSESTSYMAAEASIKALENAGVKPEEIDLILPVSYTHLDVYKRQAYFSAQFKKILGVSPSEYQDRCR